MRVLLIGGTGTLSTDTTQLCIDRGYDVYLINRGMRTNRFSSKVKCIIGDINDTNKIKSLISEYNFDVVVDYLTFDVATLKKRIEVFRGKTTQYVFISSATVFPCGDYIITEKSNLGNDGWIYSKNKLLCENYLRDHADLGFHYTIVRPYLTYGDRRIPFPIISKKNNGNLIYRMENHLPIIMCGDGKQKITVTHTRDFAIGICGLFLNDKAFENDVNIVGDCITTWNDIISILERELGIKAYVVYVDVKKVAHALTSFREELLYDKAYSHIFNNEKLKRLVPEFHTSIGIEDGLKLTIKTLKNEKNDFDELWNSSEDILANKFGNYGINISLSNRVKYFRFESGFTYFVRRIKAFLTR